MQGTQLQKKIKEFKGNNLKGKREFKGKQIQNGKKKPFFFFLSHFEKPVFPETVFDGFKKKENR